MKAEKTLRFWVFYSVGLEVVTVALFSLCFYLQTQGASWSQLIFMGASVALFTATILRCLILRSSGYIRKSIVSEFQGRFVKSWLIAGLAATGFWAVACFSSGQNYYFLVFGLTSVFFLYRHQLLLILDAITEEKGVRHARKKRNDGSHLILVDTSEDDNEEMPENSLLKNLDQEDETDYIRWRMRFAINCNRYNRGEIKLNQLTNPQNDFH